MHSTNLSVTSSQHLVKLTFTTIVSIRNETSFDAIFKTILKKKKEHLEVSQPVLLRQRDAPTRFEVDGAESEYSNTKQDGHRRLYYEPKFIVYEAVETCYLQLLKNQTFNDSEMS